uniref:Death domain-containing protein n=1 Tax=Syphacia muris TaxID=451379 RepID=A0A0N5AAH2_9BILA
MDLKRKAEDNNASPSKRLKTDEIVLEKKIRRLMSLYKTLGAEIRKIEEREVSFSDDYDEEKEMAMLRRHWRLSKKRIEIYKYLARKGVLFSEDKKQLTGSLGENRIVINNTGIERLNDLLTEFVNSPNKNEKFFGVHAKHRHLSYDDVKAVVEKLRGFKEEKVIPTDPIEYEAFITTIALASNKRMKEFTKKKHEAGLEDLILIKGGSLDEIKKLAAQQSEIPSCSGCSWEEANLELLKAIENDKDSPNDDQTCEEFDTDMPCTSEELDEGEDERESVTEASDLDASEFGGSCDTDDSSIASENGNAGDSCETKNGADRQELNAKSVDSNVSSFCSEKVVVKSKEKCGSSDICNETVITESIKLSDNEQVIDSRVSSISKQGENSKDSCIAQHSGCSVISDAVEKEGIFSNEINNKTSVESELKDMDDVDGFSVISLSSDDDSSSSIVYLE